MALFKYDLNFETSNQNTCKMWEGMKPNWKTEAPHEEIPGAFGICRVDVFAHKLKIELWIWNISHNQAAAWKWNSKLIFEELLPMQEPYSCLHHGVVRATVTDTSGISHVVATFL